ncbi:MAG: hypothetical protein LBI63_03210 [Candidatus Ancillula sp.]|nr:hypothetical protein [Candidatus Ancillula sp.]
MSKIAPNATTRAERAVNEYLNLLTTGNVQKLIELDNPDLSNSDKELLNKTVISEGARIENPKIEIVNNNDVMTANVGFWINNEHKDVQLQIKENGRVAKPLLGTIEFQSSFEKVNVNGVKFSGKKKSDGFDFKIPAYLGVYTISETDEDKKWFSSDEGKIIVNEPSKAGKHEGNEGSFSSLANFPLNIIASDALKSEVDKKVTSFFDILLTKTEDDPAGYENVMSADGMYMKTYLYEYFDYKWTLKKKPEIKIERKTNSDGASGSFTVFDGKANLAYKQRYLGTDTDKNIDASIQFDGIIKIVDDKVKLYKKSKNSQTYDQEIGGN